MVEVVEAGVLPTFKEGRLIRSERVLETVEAIREGDFSRENTKLRTLAAEWIEFCRNAVRGHEIVESAQRGEPFSLDVRAIETMDQVANEVLCGMTWEERKALLAAAGRAFENLGGEVGEIEAEDVSAASELIAAFTQRYYPFGRGG